MGAQNCPIALGAPQFKIHPSHPGGATFHQEPDICQEKMGMGLLFLEVGADAINFLSTSNPACYFLWKKVSNCWAVCKC